MKNGELINEDLHRTLECKYCKLEILWKLAGKRKVLSILREEAKGHPYPHAATVIQLLKVLRGIQFQDWKQKYQA